MPMTKKERQEVEALREQAALRWSDLPEPKRMPIPESGHVEGWDYVQSLRDVLPYWTESSAHGRGHAYVTDRNRVASQGGLRLYATERDALLALRLALQREFGKILSGLDRRIEEAKP